MINLEGKAIIEAAQYEASFATDSKGPLDRFKEMFWGWYVDNQNDTVARILFWSIKLKDLKRVFEKIFGPMPAVIPGFARPF